MLIQSQPIGNVGFPILAICVVPGEGQPLIKDVDGRKAVLEGTHQHVLQILYTVCVRSAFDEFTLLIAQRLIRLEVTNASKI